METQTESGSGRVTRSLRKRLTSVDSNQSNSRPGTPVAVSKLAVLNEAVVESPRRTIRRNSVSTPSGTPIRNTRGAAARGETPEPITPARRTTRRRSVSISKDEESTTIVKSALKQKVFDALPEEDDVDRSDFNVQVKISRIKSEILSPTSQHDEKENTPVVNIEDIKTPDHKVVLQSNKSGSSQQISARSEPLEKPSHDESMMNKLIDNASEELQKTMQTTSHSTEKDFESKTGSSVKKQHRQNIEINLNEKTPIAKKRLSSALKTPEDFKIKLDTEQQRSNTKIMAMETTPLRKTDENKSDDCDKSVEIETQDTVKVSPKQESPFRRVTRSQSKSPNIVNTKPNQKNESKASHGDKNTLLGEIVDEHKTPKKTNDIITITSDEEDEKEKSLQAQEEEPMDVDESMCILVVNSDDEDQATDFEPEKKQTNNFKKSVSNAMPTSPSNTSSKDLEQEVKKDNNLKNSEDNDKSTLSSTTLSKDLELKKKKDNNLETSKDNNNSILSSNNSAKDLELEKKKTNKLKNPEDNSVSTSPSITSTKRLELEMKQDNNLKTSKDHDKSVPPSNSSAKDLEQEKKKVDNLKNSEDNSKSIPPLITSAKYSELKSKQAKNNQKNPEDNDKSAPLSISSANNLELEKKKSNNNQKNFEDNAMFLTPVTTSANEIELGKKQADIMNNIKENKKNTPPVVTSVQYLDPITPNTMGAMLRASNQQTAVADDKRKSVVFGKKDDEKERKIVYPKTPGPHKTRKPEFHVVPKLVKPNESDSSFESALDEEQFDKEIDNDLDNILEEAVVSAETTKTPHKPKFKEAVVQSSTPIMKAVDDIVSSTVVEPSTEPNATTEESTNVEPIFNRSWNKNIHGSAKPGDKIDTIESIKELHIANESKEIKQDLINNGEESAKPIVKCMEEAEDDENADNFDQENQREESVELEFDGRNEEEKDEEEDEELSESEKPYKRTEFVEDEAEEVNSYQSGDSMDSEERRDIEENEIIDHGESVGSGDDSEGDDDDEEYEKDSFLVSDSSHLEYNSSESNSDIEEKTKKVPRKRIIESSSDDDDNEEDPNKAHDSVEDKINNENDSSTEQLTEAIVDASNVKRLDQSNCSEASKLSESASKLKDDQEDSESSKDELVVQQLNASRKDILRSMNKSDRFNKTVHEMDIDAPDDSPEQAENTKLNKSMNSTKQGIVEDSTDDSLNQNLGKNASMLSESAFGRTSCSRKSRPGLNKPNVSKTKVAPEDSSTQDEQSKSAEDSSSVDSDDEATPEPTKRSSKRGSKMLSRSFGGNMLKQTTEKRLFHSFTIDVKVASDVKRDKKDKEVAQLPHTDEPMCDDSPVESEEFDNDEDVTANAKLLDEPEEEENEKDAKFSSSEDQNEFLDGEEKEKLEKLSHLKVLFNPLQKSKRQSLYMPNSGEQDDQIEKNRKRRKSICHLSSNDFNPSQSFIETVAQRFEQENQHLRAKRKRLSKSLCNASDSMTQDLDDKQVNKKSKTDDVFSDEEQNMSDVEDVETVEKYIDEKQIMSDVEEVKERKHESPKAKQKQQMHGNDNNNNTNKILERCDEILEAANRAALEMKLKNKMNKVNQPKRQKNKRVANVVNEEVETKPQAIAPSLKKKIKRLNKEKKAVKIALQAAKDILCVNDKQKQQPQKNNIPQSKQQQHHNSKRAEKLAPVINSDSSSSTPTTSDSESHKNSGRQIIKTSAGYVVEHALSPKKPRYIEILRMPTGIVRVEPATPPHSSFREEPISPAGQGYGRRRHYAGASKMAKWHVSEQMTDCKAKSGGSSKASKGGRQMAAATATDAALHFKRQKLKNKF